jgi:hypothetical protein
VSDLLKREQRRGHRAERERGDSAMVGVGEQPQLAQQSKRAVDRPLADSKGGGQGAGGGRDALSPVGTRLGGDVQERVGVRRQLPLSEEPGERPRGFPEAGH